MPNKLIEKFHKSLDRILLRLDMVSEKPLKVAMAVSGGRDSMALLYLMNTVVRRYNIEPIVFTVDHGIRSESRDEALFVKETAEALGLECHVLSLKGLEKDNSSLQEKAREKRYDKMIKKAHSIGAHALFLAHHYDDQIETFIQRFLKGSGLKGLSSMDDVSQYKDFWVCRPMLGIRRSEIDRFVTSQAIDYVDDPSNEDDKYQRIRIRNFIQVLEDEGLGFDHFSKTVRRLQQANNALDDITSGIYKDFVKAYQKGVMQLDFMLLEKQSPEIQLRLLEKAMRQVRNNDEDHLSLSALERLCENLLSRDNVPLTLFGCQFVHMNDAICLLGMEAIKDNREIKIDCNDFIFEDRFLIKNQKDAIVRFYEEKDATQLKASLGDEAFKAVCYLPFRKTFPVILNEQGTIKTSFFHEGSEIELLY